MYLLNNLLIYTVTGDSGYALRLWMMNPFSNIEPNTPESAYDSFCRVRLIIERNGVVKMRFRYLSEVS